MARDGRKSGKEKYKGWKGKERDALLCGMGKDGEPVNWEWK